MLACFPYRLRNRRWSGRPEGMRPRPAERRFRCRAASALALVATLVLAGGCSPGGAPPSAQSAGPVTNFVVHGEVRGISTDHRQVVIRHEAVPGYMDAMTMPFRVAEPGAPAALQVGDSVEFRLRVGAEDGWVDQIRVTGHGPPVAPAVTNSPPEEDPLAPALAVGDAVPNCRFIDQNGSALELAQFKGRALALDFIFTRCPYPEFCPRLSRQFAAAQRELSADAGFTNWALLSVSFDPGYDTPARLREYGSRYHQDGRWWTLATTDLARLGVFANRFGLHYVPGADAAGQNHNLRTAVIDPSGRVTRIFIGNDWTIDQLVRAMREAAGATASH